MGEAVERILPIAYCLTPCRRRMIDPALMRFVLEMRQAGVTDARALSALERTPRTHYAPAHLEGLALDDVGAAARACADDDEAVDRWRA